MSRQKNLLKNNRTSHEEFVKVYLQYDSNEEVAEKLGMKKKSVGERASRLRRWGIKLPTRKNVRPNKEFIDEMNELISTMEKKTL